DIERYLHDEPVEACPPSASYRVRKFAKKHRGALLTTAAIALLITIGASAAIWQAIRAEQARRDSEAARAAKTEQRRAAAQQRDRAVRAEQAAVAERDAKDKALTAEKHSRGQAIAALRTMTDDIVETQLARGATLTEENKEFLRKIIKHYE